MQVDVALPVGVAHRVDGRPVDEDREVGAVIEVEAAQEVLLRLAPSRVLHREEPRDHLEHPFGAEPRAKREFVLARRRIRRRVALRRRANRDEGPLREHQRRLVGALLGPYGRGGGRGHHRAGLRRRRGRRRMKLVGELHGRTDRHAVAPRRFERERPGRRERRLVEPVARRRDHARVRDVAALVDDDFEAHGRFETLAQRLRRVRRFDARAKQRRRERVGVRSRGHTGVHGRRRGRGRARDRARVRGRLRSSDVRRSEQDDHCREGRREKSSHRGSRRSERRE